MKGPSWTLAGALCAGLLFFHPSVVAQSTPNTYSLTETQVAAKLQAAGYTNVHGIEHEGDHFDADATKDGKPVHLHVDAKTGAIVPANKEHESEENEEHERH